MFTCALLMASTISAAELESCHRRRGGGCCNSCEVVCCDDGCGNGGTVIHGSTGSQGTIQQGTGGTTRQGTTGSTGRQGTTQTGGPIKMSKEVAELINSDKEIKAAYDSIEDRNEKQEFVNDLQKTFDEATRKANEELKVKDKGTKKSIEKKKKTDDGTSLQQPGRILVQVPTNATLTFDGVATRSTQASRSFLTPELPRGRTFVYQLQSTLEVDGVTMVVSRNVEVQAGSTTVVNVSFPTAPAAAQR